MASKFEKVLTHRQREYCKQRAKGKGYAEAYKASGYSQRQNDNTARQNAYHMERDSAHSNDILATIAYYQEQAEKGAILNRQQRQAILTDMVADQEETKAVRLKALDMLNKMSGDYTEKVEHTATVSLTDKEAEARKQIAEILDPQGGKA